MEASWGFPSKKGNICWSTSAPRTASQLQPHSASKIWTGRPISTLESGPPFAFAIHGCLAGTQVAVQPCPWCAQQFVVELPLSWSSQCSPQPLKPMILWSTPALGSTTCWPCRLSLPRAPLYLELGRPVVRVSPEREIQDPPPACDGLLYSPSCPRAQVGCARWCWPRLTPGGQRIE